jgi:hypothetical protein
MSDGGNSYQRGAAIAGGAVAVSLLEILFQKGVLSLDESRTVLERAMRSVGPMQIEEARQAAGIIGILLNTKFSGGA